MNVSIPNVLFVEFKEVIQLCKRKFLIKLIYEARFAIGKSNNIISVYNVWNVSQPTLSSPQIDISGHNQK